MARSNEPGAARFGNFINYYDFNPAERRINVLPKDILSNCFHRDKNEILVLDVGCNSGILTKTLYEHLQLIAGGRKVSIIGIDLDSTLIHRCIEDNQYPANISYYVADILNSNDRESVIGQFLQAHNKLRFDLVTCFSVTLWIHINHGDEVFRKFLKMISNLSDYLILEPQPWKCYKSAVRRMKKLGCDEFKCFNSLQWKHNIVDNIVEYLTLVCGMKVLNIFDVTAWNRKIYLFENKLHASE